MTISDRRRRGALAAILAVALPVLAGGGPSWRRAEPDYAWSFPRDHWSHDGYRTEWWYFTGQLEAEDDPGRRFGYQLTMFKVGLAPELPPSRSAWAAKSLWMGHAALGDFREGKHRFSEALWREVPFLAGFGDPSDPRIAWGRAPAGSDGTWEIRWNGRGFDLSMRDDAQGFSFDLTTVPEKELVRHGRGGWSRKSRDGEAASLYYSFTRLRTVGTVRAGDRSWRVRGQSWMDQEFSSSLLAAEQSGWDWFSLRLADGRDLMLFVLRRRDGTVDWRSGTLVPASGSARELADHEWSLRSTATWTSRASKAAYPARWTVEVPGEGIRVELVPELTDQENRGRTAGGIVYWEGSVSIVDPAGAPAGLGYAELTGYAPGSRPPM